MAIEALSNIIRNSIGAFDSNGSTGASSTYVDVDVLLCSVARLSGSFDITDATVSNGDRIDIVQLPGPYFGKGTSADEFELMGPVNFIAVAKNGYIKVYWTSAYFQKGYCRVSYKVTPAAAGGSSPYIYKTGKSSVSGDPGTYPEVTLTNISSGDLIIAYAAKYAIPNGESGMVVQDSDDGSYTDGQTFTKVMTTSHDLGSSFLFNAFTSVSNRNSATRKIRFFQDGFSSLIVAVIKNFNTSSIYDNPSGYSASVFTGTGSKIIDNPVTTNPSNLVLSFFGWYSSSVIMTYDGAWPFIEGFNDGNGQIDQMILVGKQVSSIGSYDPAIIVPSDTGLSGISLIIKGP